MDVNLYLRNLGGNVEVPMKVLDVMNGVHRYLLSKKPLVLALLAVHAHYS